MQLGTIRAIDDPRVVPGREAVESEVQDPPEHEVEANECIAADARVRRAALEVVAMERLDHALAELALEVPAVIRNVEQRGHASRILHRRKRAASSVPRAFLLVFARPLLKRDADDVMTLGLKKRGGDRRVDPARHRDGDPHLRFSTMLWATISASSPTP